MQQRFFSHLRKIVLAALLPVTSVFAGTPMTYTDSNRALFRFDVPDFWTLRSGGPRELTAPGTEDARNVSRVIGMQPTTEPRLWVGFISPFGVRNFDEAAAYLHDIGPFLVKDATVDSRKSRLISGRSARTIAGSGRRDGKAVNYTAVIIALPNSRMAISVVVMEAGLDAANLETVNQIFASFRAVE